MAVIISMLRGVNVGGHNKIKMDALRELYQSLKLRAPRRLAGLWHNNHTFNEIVSLMSRRV